MEELQPAVKDNVNFISLEHATKKIAETFNKVKDDFIYIGFLLWEVNHYKYYESKGYESVVEYAEKELGFKQASTYNFISICAKFSRKTEFGTPSMFLDEKFKDYNFTQLVEIKSLKVDQLDSITPDMSKKQIRDKKKELKSNENNIIDVEFKQDQVDLVENQTVILVDPVPAVKNKDNLSLKQVDSIIENKILKDKIKLFEEEKNNQFIDIQKLKKENLLLKKEDQVVNLEENEKIRINYNVLLKETDILRVNFKAINEDHTKLMHENEKLKKENEKIKKENLKLKKSNLDPKQNNSSDNIISDVLKVLNNEWSKVENDDFAEGVNKAIRLINQKLESNT